MIVVIMGVTGCGKTTVGRLLAGRLGAAFFEGDDFHPPENVAKMQSGRPLDDADRLPWLRRLQQLLCDAALGERPAVLACSALKQSYRDILAAAAPGQVRFLYLRITPDVARSRLADRRGHFMPASLIDSQFADLQEPRGPEAVTLDAALPPEQLVEEAMRQLRGEITATDDPQMNAEDGGEQQR